MKSKTPAIIFAVLAAALYAINVPFSKLLLVKAQPAMTAAFLYLGAGIVMLIYSLTGRLFGKETIKEHEHVHEV